ncbi:hypothetical protein AGLY_002515 [Aphis glycines]|uniref:Uncharacterized protein n=1 Tax=Aphis glycines TaxID=307491 RepID=A0A6G0U0L3_APHGL|nr:hypothetical protein AGLY_002515 [Aphis glycines]
MNNQYCWDEYPITAVNINIALIFLRLIMINNILKEEFQRTLMKWTDLYNIKVLYFIVLYTLKHDMQGRHDIYSRILSIRFLVLWLAAEIRISSEPISNAMFLKLPIIVFTCPKFSSISVSRASFMRIIKLRIGTFKTLGKGIYLFRGISNHGLIENLWKCSLLIKTVKNNNFSIIVSVVSFNLSYSPSTFFLYNFLILIFKREDLPRLFKTYAIQNWVMTHRLKITKDNKNINSTLSFNKVNSVKSLNA